MEPLRDRIPDEPVVDERFHLVLPRRYPWGAPIMRAYVTCMSVLSVQNVRSAPQATRKTGCEHPVRGNPTAQPRALARIKRTAVEDRQRTDVLWPADVIRPQHAQILCVQSFHEASPTSQPASVPAAAPDGAQ